MANLATLKTPIQLKSDARFYAEQAIPVLIKYDTPGQVLSVMGQANRSIYLVGLECVNGSDYQLSFHSGSTLIQTYPLTANSGRVEPLCPTSLRILCSTEPGEALGISATVALPTFTLFVVVV
jgi:hypothetical protein